MIYLLKDCYRDDSGKVIDILKIGYSSKPFKESRENQYKTHNYGFKLLQEREGDAELENYLHKRFSKYLLPDSYEWFYYNEEIINGFNIIQNIIVTTKEEYIENIKYYILRNLESPEKLYKIHQNNIIEELQNYSEYNIEEEIIYKQRIKEVFELGYSIIKENIEKDCILSNSYFNDIPEEIEKDWLEKNPWKNYAELYYRTDIREKTKEEFDNYLKEKEELTNNLLSVYDSATPSEKHALSKTYKTVACVEKYKKNFVSIDEHTGSDLKPVFNKLVMIAEMKAFEIQTVLGPDKMKALQFDAIDMRKTYEEIIDNQGIDIRSYILSEFKIGEKITKNKVKDRLRKLYEKVGYKKTPKAVDLGECFIIKNCKIPNSDGTRNNGYEIIKVKEGSDE